MLPVEIVDELDLHLVRGLHLEVRNGGSVVLVALLATYDLALLFDL